jgi:hypothetical protein
MAQVKYVVGLAPFCAACILTSCSSDVPAMKPTSPVTQTFPVTSPSTTAQMSVADLGRRETATFDNVIYCAKSHRRIKTVGDSISTETADGEYVLIDLAVINNSQRKHTVTTAFMDLIDENGKTYSRDSQAAITMQLGGEKKRAAMFDDVEPGQSLTMILVFDAPATSRDFELKIPAPGPGDKDTTIKVY